MKEKEWKNWLKTQHSKKIMVSGPITSWQINGKKTETVTDFSFLGSKITVDGDCSHEIKRCLFPGRKAMTNLNSVLKSRNSILPTNVHIFKAIVFPVVMYGCESWTKKRLSTKESMPSNCGAREDSWESLGLQGDQINQSWRKSTLNVHWKDWCWSWSSNILATWWEQQTHWRRPWCWERLRGSGQEGNRG